MVNLQKNLTIGQKNTVNVYRFISKDTIEEDIIERAKRKMVLEYSIIKTMDTSGEGIMGKKGSAGRTIAGAGNVTQEELQTILKFGAKNLFKANAIDAKSGQEQSNQMEQMNLDDVLSRAEFHEGAEQSGTALGSAEFLEQFHVSDVAVNQMSWEELVPEHLREKIRPGDDEIPEEFLHDGPRKRVTTSVTYKGAELTLSSGQKRKRKSTPRKTTDPIAKLNEKECRSFIRAILKFGDIDRRYGEISADADITHKDKDVVVESFRDILKACTKAIDDVPVEPKSKTITKTKVITATYDSVTGINAPQLIQRVDDCKVLSKRLENQAVSSFRIPWAAKPVTNWSAPWGSKDDAMLLAGIYKHGFGSWEAIQDDPELKLERKLFLSSHDKLLPKGVHLVRRGEILLKLLAENELKKVSSSTKSDPSLPKPASSHQTEGQHVNKNKSSDNGAGISKVKAGENGMDKSLSSRATSVKPKGTRKPKANKKEGDSSVNESMDEARIKEELRPVKRELRILKSPPEDLESKDKVHLIKTSLTTIGQFIQTYLGKMKVGNKRSKMERHLWKFVSYFWPKKISSSSYRTLCTRILSEVTNPTEKTEDHSSNAAIPRLSDIKSEKSGYPSGNGAASGIVDVKIGV